MKGFDAIWALVPLKAPSRSKTRLSPVLTADECAAFARAMARDLLSALTGVRQLSGIAIVGDGPWVANLGREWRCLVIQELGESGLSASLEFAAGELVNQGANRMIILPGDLPGLSIGDVEQLLRSHRQGITLCAAEQDGGTNALVCELPAPIPFQFGVRSADKHCALAKSRGIPIQHLELAGFSRDIDTPADLAWLARQPSHGETRRFLDRAGLRRRLENELTRATA